ncbi:MULTISPECIES: recombinase family protein [Deinococcus]|uniref:Recombinase family protein n=1 Tax=Deinococcus aquaticus TaxID=328692 RepID=A0ABY7V5X2_9DEIO|nr:MULTISPECIES: recombinase family protein [Deinococcus]PIG95921.1 resolvase [Deinococcus sp. UR1]WDA60567.1 recombinase family protein [Deinococcus aquaticus]
MPDAIAYYRVSTAKQGQSGLGLESQRAIITALAHARHLTITAHFTEIESGRKKNRAQLEAALDHARRSNAILLIAKLDRLARNVAFTSALMEAGVDFIAADIPDANRMTLHVMAALAEQEAQLISERTRAALAARKARGLTLGRPENLTPEARALGPQVQREAARVATQQAAAFAAVLRERGDTLQAIATRLNHTGFRTRHGSLWSPTQVKRILDRMG